MSGTTLSLYIKYLFDPHSNSEMGTEKNQGTKRLSNLPDLGNGVARILKENNNGVCAEIILQEI